MRQASGLPFNSPNECLYRAKYLAIHNIFHQSFEFQEKNSGYNVRMILMGMTSRQLLLNLRPLCIARERDEQIGAMKSLGQSEGIEVQHMIPFCTAHKITGQQHRHRSVRDITATLNLILHSAFPSHTVFVLLGWKGMEARSTCLVLCPQITVIFQR